MPQANCLKLIIPKLVAGGTFAATNSTAIYFHMKTYGISLFVLALKYLRQLLGYNEANFAIIQGR